MGADIRGVCVCVCVGGGGGCGGGGLKPVLFFLFTDRWAYKKMGLISGGRGL